MWHQKLSPPSLLGAVGCQLSPLLSPQVEKELALASQKLLGKLPPVPDVEDCGKHRGRSWRWLRVWALL